MLNLTWIKNPRPRILLGENEVLPRLAGAGIADLAQQVEEFRTHGGG